MRRVVGRRDRIVFARLVNLHRIAVEFRVGEMAGGAAKVDQREIELPCVLMNAGAAPDDLLELGHRADPRSSTIRRQVWASTPVDRSREVVTSTGYFDFRVDEVAELVLAFLVAASDTHDIALIFGHESAFSLMSAWRIRAACSSIDAEHDGFLEAVAALLQELGDLLRRQLVRSSSTSVRSKSLAL